MDTQRVVPFLIGALLAVSPVLGQSTAVSLSTVEQAYRSLDGLRASFTQHITSDFAGDTTVVRGTVTLAGNKYRVRTDGQTIVTDGTTTWIYTPADSQVVINDAGSGQSSVTPTTFLSTSAQRYKITASASTERLGVPHEQLEIVATDSTARFQNGTLWVRSSDHLLTRMKATDRNGSTLDLRLADLTINPTLGNEAFRFSPPPEAEVIDLRNDQ